MPYLHRKKQTNTTKSLKKELRIKIYSSQKWKNLRNAHRMANPLCEKCLERGERRLMDDVHHIVSPFGFYDQLQIQFWAYNPNNVISLCRECHNKEHAV